MRQQEVAEQLRKRKFRGEYLLISTKPDSVYSRMLVQLNPSQKLIVDLYTPIFLEKELSLSKWKPQDWLTRWRNKEMARKFLLRGNHFLVANRRQRDYWLETSKSLGLPLKLNDISVFPTGSSLTINHQPSNIHDRQVVLWFGGIYPWMDPEPLIKAFGRICRKYPKWKLRILGGLQPGTGYKDRYEKLVNKAKSVIPGLQLQIIEWQKNEDLDKYFEDIAFAVHLVKQTPEDYYAHRVRLLTLLRAGIPVLTSGRDVISELLVKEKSGIKFTDTPVILDNILRKTLSSKSIIKEWQKNTVKIQEKFIKSEMDIRIKYNEKS